MRRDFAASVNQWKSASVGARFDFGDAVQTRLDASGTVSFDDGALMRLEPRTTVRFLHSAPSSNEYGIDVEAGDAILESGDLELTVRTKVGVAVLQPGTIARIGKGESGVRFLVSVGLARLESGGGVLDLLPGRGVEVGIGMAILDEFGEAVPTANVATTVPEPEPEEKAIVAAVSGSGVTVRRPGQKTFEPLPAGEHELLPGTRVKLGSKDSVNLKRGALSAGLKGPGTYLVVEGENSLVEPVSGGTTLRADGHDMSMDIPGGKVTALGSEGLSIGDVSIDKRGRVRVHARAGRLRIETRDENTVIRAGESADVERGKVSVSGRGPTHSDVAISAGGSLVVHDPEPPTAIGIDVGDKCQHTAIVEQVHSRGGSTTSVGLGKANVFADKGRSHYKLRCLSDQGVLSGVVAEGRITVLHDGGTATLPRRAPSNVVSTDGRDYTVMYQNLLPAITVRWPNAPEASAYSLRVVSPAGTKTYNAASASYGFSSGALAEGTHAFQFQSTSGRRSRMSKVTIRFDNAAPKASIRSPANGSFSAGQTVAVSGIALPGWEVIAQGERLRMDSEQRFSGSVVAGPRGLVLQFAHPDRGVHYYLRRVAGAAP